VRSSAAIRAPQGTAIPAACSSRSSGPMAA